MKKDLTGNKYGRLTVISFDHTDKHRSYWKCKCECGNIKIIRGGNLTDGSTKSCGCLQKEKVKKLGYKNKTHGRTKSRLYKVWCAIKRRCYNKNARDYKNYGGRGITICKEWEDFSVFQKWAFENGYNEKAKRGESTIDRINNNGSYSPENCRFISNKKQCRNKRTNRILTIKGEKHCIIEWSEISGIPGYVIGFRINRLHWNAYKAVFEPLQKHICL